MTTISYTDPLRWAKYYATNKHHGQLYGEHRKPYTYHLEAVERVLVANGHTGPVPLQIAWLHDILEDTDATPEELTSLFGAYITSVVWAITDEPGKNRAERKAKTYEKIRNSGCRYLATMVKLADRIANVQEGGRLVSMYRKEQPEFHRQLWHKGTILPHLWKALDDAFLANDKLTELERT